MPHLKCRFDLALIGATIIVSSFVSGVFGMAGGMILLGVLLDFLDVAAGDDPVLDHPDLRQRLAGRAVAAIRALADLLALLLGAVLAFALMRSISFVPDKAMVYLTLGLMPFVVELLPAGCDPTSNGAACRSSPACSPRSSRSWPASAGSFSTSSSRRACSIERQRMPPRRSLSRQPHRARGLFRSRSGVDDASRLGDLSPAIVLAIAGTSLAPFVIERMTDHGFRQWTRAIIFAISAIYLVRAAWLAWQG